MRRLIAMFGVALLAGGTLAAGVPVGQGEVSAGGSTGSYVDPTYGFSMGVPRLAGGGGPGGAGGGGNERVVPVMFAGPPTGLFATNVNVMVDPVRTTRKQYLDTTLAAMRQIMQGGGGGGVAQTRPGVAANAGPSPTTQGAAIFKLNNVEERQVAGRDAALLDFETTLNARHLRYLQLIVVAEDRVYVITCTAIAENFDAYEKEFRKCLDSFRLPM